MSDIRINVTVILARFTCVHDSYGFIAAADLCTKRKKTKHDIRNVNESENAVFENVEISVLIAR
jgi:hypothetical protein